MITLVKSESFKAFEAAYNKCFETTYKDDKAVELGREFVGRRMLNTHKDTFDLLNYKGISTDRAIEFVDSVRDGKMDPEGFVKECHAKCIEKQRLIDVINDIGSMKIQNIISVCRHKDVYEVVNVGLLQKLVLYTGVMVEVRINSYSLLARCGDYDNWCKIDETAVMAYEYFSTLLNEYARRIRVCLKHSRAVDYDNMSNFDFDCLVEKVLIGFTNGTTKPEEYTICDSLVYTYVMLRRLTTLIDGSCEWFWNED